MPMSLGIGLGIGLGGGRTIEIFDWYVSSVFGNDANTGTTFLTPFQTLGAATTAASAGDTIGLARGSLWREHMLLPAVGVQVGAYGFLGSKPEIRAHDIAANGSFSATATPDVYSISWSHSISVAATTWFQVFENGVPLIRAASLAACGSTPGSFYAPQPTAGPDTINVHPLGSTNPATDGKVYEITKRDHCVESFFADCVVDSVKTVGSGHDDGSLVLRRANSRISRCDGRYGKKHIFYLGSGLYEDCTGIGVEDASTVYVTYMADPTGEVTTYRRCVADGSLPGGVIPAQTTGFHAHGTGGNRHAHVYYEDCEAIRCTTGFGGDADAVTSTRSKATDCIRGILADTPDWTDIQGFYDGRGSSASWAAGNLYFYVRGDLAMSGTVVLAGEEVDFNTLFYAENDGDITLRQNTFAQGGDKFTSIAHCLTTMRVTAERNVFYNIARLTTPTAGITVESADFNAYWKSSGDISFNSGGVTYSTLPIWQAAGFDPESVSADPGFTTPVSSWDARTDAAITEGGAINLQAGSSYYGVSPVVPVVTSVEYVGGPLVGLPQFSAYTATGTPHLTPTYEWRLDGVLVATTANYTPLAPGTLDFTVTVTNEGGSDSATATSEILASNVTLDLDFEAGTYTQQTIDYGSFAAWLAAKATFTRAAAAYYTDSAGAMALVSSGAPRLGDVGLLYEPARTNKFYRSQDYDNTAWSKLSNTITANAAAAPDGTTTADLSTATANSEIRVSKLDGPARGTTYPVPLQGVAEADKRFAFSAYAKPVNSDARYFWLRDSFSNFNIGFDTTAGALSSAPPGMSTAILPVANGFYRCSAVIDEPSVVAGFGNEQHLVISTSPTNPSSGASGAQSHGWGAQFEEIPSDDDRGASSYIPTVDSPVTRPADQLTLNLPSGTHYALLTFDDDSQQVVPTIARDYTLATDLQRYLIKRLKVLSLPPEPGVPTSLDFSDTANSALVAALGA